MMTMLGVRPEREYASATPSVSGAFPNVGGSIANHSPHSIHHSATALAVAAIGCLSAWMTTRSPVLWRNASAPQPSAITISAIEQQLSAPLPTPFLAGLACLSLGNLALSTRAAPASSTWVCLAPTATVAVHSSVTGGSSSSSSGASGASGALSFAEATVGKPAGGARWAPGTSWNKGRYVMTPDAQSVIDHASNNKLMVNSREWESMWPSLTLDGACFKFCLHFRALLIGISRTFMTMPFPSRSHYLFSCIIFFCCRRCRCHGCSHCTYCLVQRGVAVRGKCFHPTAPYPSIIPCGQSTVAIFSLRFGHLDPQCSLSARPVF
jgi:hypothetical protein